MNRLRELRLQQSPRVTLEELANILGCSAANVYRIESGQGSCSVEQAIKLAGYFECSVEEIFGASPLPGRMPALIIANHEEDI